MKDRPYFYAIGKRKTARATVKLFFNGTGEYTVNGVRMKDWTDDHEMFLTAIKPLNILGLKKDIDLDVRTSGGGKKAQAASILLGVARALAKKEHAYREQLKQEGLLTRDARVKERKKPGLKRARKSGQWSKR